MSEKIKSAIIKANQESKSAVFVSQMYSKSLTERRNAALKYRADLKEQDPSVQGHVKFPAILMIKHTGERKYSLEKEFWTIYSFEFWTIYRFFLKSLVSFSNNVVEHHHHLSIVYTFSDFLLQRNSLQLLPVTSLLLSVSLTYGLTFKHLSLGY